MRTLTYYIGTTLDGYIAGPAGQIEHYPVSDDHVEHMRRTYPEVLPTHVRRHLGFDEAANQRFDTVVMGRSTYDPALEIGVTDPYAHLRTYVASSQADIASGDPAITVTSDPVATVRELKAEPSPLGIWLAGGGRLAGALAGEIDEVVLKLYPVVAGDGVPAVTGAFDPRRFDLVDTTTFASGCTTLTYRRATGEASSSA